MWLHKVLDMVWLIAYQYLYKTSTCLDKNLKILLKKDIAQSQSIYRYFQILRSTIYIIYHTSSTCDLVRKSLIKESNLSYFLLYQLPNNKIPIKIAPGISEISRSIQTDKNLNFICYVRMHVVRICCLNPYEYIIYRFIDKTQAHH